ncbi:MAG: DNA polymerase III subunit gamma/tau, partial [Oscillospiraceae bacterium]|nr:DNA polymerase III subunit gamma/tau [Oscillospiraceae bacterium]
MHQALYRKWRPQSFADVVGQSAVTDTLVKQIEMGKTSHAYLFSGSRGTGKTTCAKIFSKAINCENPFHGNPCNECPSCRGISSGEILDIVEIDAASNNGVDYVREMREEAIYTPANVKKRVYIIDEVHMFSTSAFNALLKIMEEPPPHVVFILATTELHKVPATVASRCQRFVFKRISYPAIAERLRFIAKNEGAELSAEAADYIAYLSDGAMRDALSLLDQ